MSNMKRCVENRHTSLLLRSAFALVTVLSLVPTGDAWAQELQVVDDRVWIGGMRREGDVGSVRSVDLSTGEEREFFRPANGYVFDFKVAPSAGWVAVRTQLVKYDVPVDETTTIVAGGRRVFEETTLRILTPSGTEVDSIASVRSYGWSPDGRRLAYVIGEYRGGYADSENTSTWIWNGPNQERQRISDRGHEVIWPSFDGNIYVWPRTRGIAGEALRYDLERQTLEPTSHLSIYFSPSGAFYYHPGRGLGLQENVFVTQGDVGLKETSAVLSALTGWRPLGWAPDADLLLMEATRRSKPDGPDELVVMVFNPKADSATELQSPGVVCWASTLNQFILRRGERFQRKPMSEMVTPKR
jgi:hypothetical protein